MFAVVRIIVLIACAYAGSAVAGMQSDPSHELSSVFQP